VVEEAERNRLVLKVDLRGRGIVAVQESVVGQAHFQPDGFLSGARQGGCQHGTWIKDGEVRALVEVQRRFGGLAPRALLGGKFVPSRMGRSPIQVGFGSSQEIEHWPSHLWKKPFVLGLPESFAAAVLHSVATLDGLSFSCGTLIIDQAGFDPVESAPPVFGQAAMVLAYALEAMGSGSNVEESVVRAMESW
jgi:hypothetical protein